MSTENRFFVSLPRAVPGAVARAGVLVCSIALGGCAVATWGDSYNVLNATPDQIVIEYDRVLKNPSMLMPVITQHCAAYGRVPYVENVSRPGGLGTVQADCRPAGATPAAGT